MRAAIVAAAVLLFPARALAAQFVVTEVTYEHSATTTTDSHLRLAPLPGTPSNWKAPTDYATNGFVWVRLEVFTKPSAENTRFQICFEATPSYACTDQSPIYTKTGVYTWGTNFPKMYQYSMVDWTKGVNKVALILKDDKNVKPAPENVGAARSALFMPTKVRVTVTVVSPGSTYMPPADTLDAGLDASKEAAVDAPSDSEMDSATTEDTAVADTNAPVTDTGSAAIDSDLSVDTGSPAADAGTDDGGGCSTTGRPTGSLGWLLLAGLVLRRRAA
jgi:hypothetical protein